MSGSDKFYTIEELQEKLESTLDEVTLNRLANLFQAMSDPTRIKIIYLLTKQKLCVAHISEALGMSQSAVSHQLSFLRRMYLVKAERRGRNAIYSLDDDHVFELFKGGLEHAQHK